MDWLEAKQQLIRKPSRRRAFEKVDLAYEIGNLVIDARLAKKMTQQQLADRLGTQQPSIARLEKGSSLPSLSLLVRIAEALGTQLLPPRFEFMEQSQEDSYSVWADFQASAYGLPNPSWEVLSPAWFSGINQSSHHEHEEVSYVPNS